jgi:hypothetical protein
MAFICAALGYLLTILIAVPSAQSFLINNSVPFGMLMLLIPITDLTSMLPIDPDAGMIYLIFGGSNAILYGAVPDTDEQIEWAKKFNFSS